MKVATRRLLEEQLVVVAVLGSGKKSDAMWHVPQHHSLSALHCRPFLIIIMITMLHIITPVVESHDVIYVHHKMTVREVAEVQ